MAKTKRSSETTVTRISASDSGSSQSANKPSKAKPAKTSKALAEDDVRPNIVKRFFGYFKGAWYELKQVRWPTRSATWSLTAAVLGFSLFFIVFIILLDAGFKYVFEVIFK